MHAADNAHPWGRFRREAWALGLMLGINAVVVVAWYLLMLGGIAASVQLTPRPLPAWNERVYAQPAKEMIAEAVALHGRDIFRSICGVCHGQGGFGMTGLGKDLVHSDFAADASDSELVAFIERGRPIDDPLNTSKVAMPPKGGNEAMTTDDLQAVVSFVRALQDPRRMPTLPPWQPKPVELTEADKAAALAAAGGDEELAAFIANGNKLFHSTCVACHGKGGVGIPGNGKTLVNNAFIKSLDADGLLAFVQRGRAPGEPLNTTGIQMPPKGGNPALTEDDILDIIDYLRTLENAQTGGAEGH